MAILGPESALKKEEYASRKSVQAKINLDPIAQIDQGLNREISQDFLKDSPFNNENPQDLGSTLSWIRKLARDPLEDVPSTVLEKYTQNMGRLYQIRDCLMSPEFGEELTFASAALPRNLKPEVTNTSFPFPFYP